MIDKIDKEILNYIEKGLTYREIAKILNLTTIAYRIKKMRERGVEIPQKGKKLNEKDKEILKYKEEGLTNIEIAKILNLTTIGYRIKKMREQGIEIPNTYKKTRKNMGLSERDKQILNLLREGLTQVEIAKEMGISKQRINSKIKKMKDQGVEGFKENVVSKRNKTILKYLEEGLNIKEIAEEMGLNYSTILDRIKKMKEQGVEIPKVDKKRRKPLSEQDKTILEYREEGLTIKEIAKKMGIAPITVFRRIKKMKEREIDIPGRKKASNKRNETTLKESNERELIETIIKLKETRNATDEQLYEIAKVYGIDKSKLSERFNSLDER